MRKVLILMVLILTGCGSLPAPTAGAADPNIELAVAAARVTGTAQSVEWTATAQVSGWTATAQSWTATPSPVPTATMTPSITPTPTVNATGTMIVERMNAEINELNRQAEFRSIFTPLLVVVALALLILGIAYVAITISRSKDFQVIERGEGDAPLVLSRSRRRVVDMDANPNFSAGFDESLLRAAFAHWLKEKFGVDPVMPQITAERQDATKSRDQMIDMKSRTKVSNAAVQRLLESQGLNKVLPEPTHEPVLTLGDDLFALPSWDLVKGWTRDKDLLPLGNSNKGLEYWDLRIQAHLAVFGMTRSGKDRRLLRPLVAFMLASGQRVVMIGKETDFLPFMGHPNAVFVPVYDVTERGEAMKYAAALDACVTEKNNRIRHMAARGVSLWEHERTFIVLDELGNAIREMPDDLSERAMKKATSTVNEAGKAGMSLVFSAQRPKGFVDLTTQCGRVAFQVESDTEKGYALGIKGADRLPDIPTGYFYKKFRTLQVTGGFEPSDDDIRMYLSMFQVQALPKADWIDTVSTPRIDVIEPTPLQIIEPTAPESLPVKPVDEIAEMAEGIRSRWTPGMSKSAVSRLLGKEFEGTSWTAKVNRVIAYLTATTPTATTDNQPEIGSFAPEMA